jgi:hypothetical protein
MTSKPDRGKRVSLHPLNFEQALGALIQVPPEPENPKPRKKKRAVKKARRTKK